MFVNMVRQFTLNFIFIDVYSGCKLRFFFFSAFLDLQSIRNDEATTSKDIPITSRKTELKLQTLYSKTSIIRSARDHRNPFE